METRALIANKYGQRQLLPYRIANSLFFGAVIVLNALASTGALGGNTSSVGNVSDSYNTSFTPAGWAFSIWGPIYLWVGAFCVYTAILPGSTESAKLLTAVGPWFIISCIFNIAWIATFVFGSHVAVLISTFWLALILISLLIIIVKIDSWRSVRSSLWDVWIVDVAFSMYAGWCTVACIANVVISCTAYGWVGAPWTAQGWSALMICVAAAVNVAVLATRQDPVFALVFSWAAAAIADAHREETDVYWTAAVTSGLIAAAAFGVTIFHIVRWAGRLQRRAKKTYNPDEEDPETGGDYVASGR